MKILITGASGFIGSRVLNKLKEKYGSDAVIALSSHIIQNTPTILSCNYQFSDKYLLENGCEDVEILMHIGAYIPKEHGTSDDITLTTENIINTEQLLTSDLPNLKKVIFISTTDVYLHCNECISEEAAAIPSTLYGWSKLYCEQMIAKYCGQNKLSFEILRLGHVYGEGEEKYKKAIPIMIRNAIEKKDFSIYGDGEAIRTFIYIDDVAEAIIKSIELKDSEIINVVGNEKITINQLVQMIQAIAGYEIPITRTKVNTQNVNYFFDNSKLKKYLITNFTPLEAGLQKEYNYMQEKMKNEYHI